MNEHTRSNCGSRNCPVRCDSQLAAVCVDWTPKHPAPVDRQDVYSPRFVVVSDLPEWTVWDQKQQCDLFPTKSGNRDRSCGRCYEETAHMIADALNSKSTAQDVMGVLDADFSACLLNIEKSLSGLADIAESKSVTLGDKYGVLADGCIDCMESVQVLRNQANDIEMDEFDSDPA